MNSVDRTCEKFLLLEFDNKEQLLPYSFPRSILNLRKKGKIDIHDYFSESNCGFTTLELSDCYVVQLYFIPNISKDYSLSFLFRDEEWISKNDVDNIFKHLVIDVSYSLHHRKINNISLFYPFDFLYFNQNFNSKLLCFPKVKFSKNECNYWGNVCLRIFVGLHKELDMIITKRVQELYMKKLLKKMQGNTITFFLESAIEAKQRHFEIRNEIISLREKEEK